MYFPLSIWQQTQIGKNIQALKMRQNEYVLVPLLGTDSYHPLFSLFLFIASIKSLILLLIILSNFLWRKDNFSTYYTCSSGETDFTIRLQKCSSKRSRLSTRIQTHPVPQRQMQKDEYVPQMKTIHESSGCLLLFCKFVNINSPVPPPWMTLAVNNLSKSKT